MKKNKSIIIIILLILIVVGGRLYKKHQKQKINTEQRRVNNERAIKASNAARMQLQKEKKAVANKKKDSIDLFNMKERKEKMDKLKEIQKDVQKEIDDKKKK